MLAVLDGGDVFVVIYLSYDDGPLYPGFKQPVAASCRGYCSEVPGPENLLRGIRSHRLKCD